MGLCWSIGLLFLSCIVGSCGVCWIIYEGDCFCIDFKRMIVVLVFGG